MKFIGCFIMLRVPLQSTLTRDGVRIQTQEHGQACRSSVFFLSGWVSWVLTPSAPWTPSSTQKKAGSSALSCFCHHPLGFSHRVFLQLWGFVIIIRYKWGKSLSAKLRCSTILQSEARGLHGLETTRAGQGQWSVAMQSWVQIPKTRIKVRCEACL